MNAPYTNLPVGMLQLPLPNTLTAPSHNRPTVTYSWNGTTDLSTGTTQAPRLPSCSCLPHGPRCPQGSLLSPHPHDLLDDPWCTNTTGHFSMSTWTTYCKLDRKFTALLATIDDAAPNIWPGGQVVFPVFVLLLTAWLISLPTRLANFFWAI